MNLPIEKVPNSHHRHFMAKVPKTSNRSPTLGKTSDGVWIIRPRHAATHFTDKEIARAVAYAYESSSSQRHSRSESGWVNTGKKGK